MLQGTGQYQGRTGLIENSPFIRPYDDDDGGISGHGG
jgi:hypothetical protein